MEFYALLSEYYDEIFKSSEVKLDFLSEGLRADAKVLDVGAATGTFSIPLARRGYCVYAIDSEPDMVARMKEKSHGIENHKAGVLSMEAASKLGAYYPFNLVLCIGNTISHMASLEAMKGFVAVCSELLPKGGSLVIQVVNYDRVIPVLEEDGEYVFPEITLSDGSAFKRRYTYSIEHYEGERNRLVFEGSIGGHIGTTLLTPVMSNELIRMALEAGFTKASLHGDFDGSDYAKDSPALIMRAVK